ncbi:hypothetical protein [Nocardiopsis synnemataformans]|uniref:hypothetical protein n=1 Tax=Nocardiopsis synnemataformans TaxID=61305 RepID=UPI003EBBEA24
MPRPLPRRTPLVGPACPVCDHPSCRVRRAQRLPRLGGHRSEFAREHTQAAEVQKCYRHLIIWWGESTQSFWAITPTGMVEAADVDALLLLLWSHSTQRTDPPAARVKSTSERTYEPLSLSQRIRRNTHTGRRPFSRPRAFVHV